MTRRISLMLLPLLAGGALASCKDSTGPAEPPSFRLQVKGETAPLRSVLLSLEGISGEPTILAGSAVLHQAAQVGVSHRVLLIGPIDSSDLLEVKAASTSVSPTAVVLDASAGASAGYRQLTPADVTVTWVRQ